MPFDDDLNPFVGPRPFDRVDMGTFFGREREVAELVSLVFAHRTVLLYAASGAGKTSLLNAGLIPALEREAEFDVLPVARVRGLKSDAAFPSGAQNVYVFNVLSNWTGSSADASVLPVNLAAARSQRVDMGVARRGPGRRASEGPLTGVSLAEFLAERPHPITADGFPAPRAVVFDQFEELFRLHPEHWRHRAPFFEQIAAALKQDDLLRVVFAMREEYLAELDKYRALLPASPMPFRLERLGFTAALSAVTEPLRTRQRRFAPDVAESLVRNLMKFRVDTGTGDSVEVDGEAVEPVQLQVVCRTLWSELPPDVDVITEGHVSRFGDVDEVLGRFYGECITAAAAKAGVSERELRVWVEKQFITAMGTRSTVYRTRLSTAGMSNDAIDELEARHLIRAEWRAGARWYELTHDRLIAPIRASNRAVLYGAIDLDADNMARRQANQALAQAETAWLESRSDDVQKYQQEAIRIYESLGDTAAVADTLLRMCELYIRSGDLPQAREQATEAGNIYRGLGDRLGVADARRYLGVVEFRVGAYEESLALLDDALAIYDEEQQDIGAAWTFLAMADVNVANGALEQAMQYAQMALDLFLDSDRQPGVAAALELLGALEVAVGEPQAALGHYETAEQVYRELGDAAAVSAMLAQRAYIHSDHDDYDEAVSLFTEAIKLAPNDLSLYSARAGASWYGERYEQAIADYNEVLATLPDDPDARSGRGGVLADAGRFEEALDDLEHAIRFSDGTVIEAYARNGRAFVLGGLGRYDEAMEEFETSLSLAPENAFAFYNRAQVHAGRGDLEQAMVDLYRALEARDPPLSRPKLDRARAMIDELDRVGTP